MKFHAATLLMLTALPAAAENARLEFALGVLEKTRGVNTAQDHFEKARLLDPLALPLVRLAVAQRLETGDRAGAVKLFRDLASARPDDLEVQVLFADFLAQQGRGDSMAEKLATDTLESALQKHPGNPRIIRPLHQLHAAAGRTQQAAALLDQLAQDEPESALLYASLTRSAADADEAAKRDRLDRHYLLALESNPGNVELARTASDHFHNTGRTAEAIEILKRHTAAEPSSLDLRTRTGILLFQEKRDDEGRAELEAVLAIHPRKALAHQALAKFHRLRENAGPARFHAGELLKIRGGSQDEFLKLAGEWLDAGDPRQARLLLENAVFDHPANSALADQLAIATRRDPETRPLAARRFREAEAARLPEAQVSPDFLIESAEVMIADGQGKAAEDRLRTAIRSYPADAKKETAAALRRLALLWESENRNTEAAKALRQRADGLDR
jgi:predicted Zn-dependent protease